MSLNYLKSISIILFFLLNKFILAQPSIEWAKTYGGSATESFNDIQQTIDEGYIAVGYTRSSNGDVSSNYGFSDIWITKLDISGNIEWEKNYGGTLNESAYSIQQISDGGYIIAGKSSSNDEDVGGNMGGEDFWIFKIDMSGNIEWEQNYGGSEDEEASSIQQTTDGGYIVAGHSNSDDGDFENNNGGCDLWVLKLDEVGTIEWKDNYGGSDDESVASILQTKDGGYIVSTTSQSDDGDVGGNYGRDDFWIFKLDMSGQIEWEKNYGGSDYDFAGSIVALTGGDGYIVTGSTRSMDGDVSDNYGSNDAWIIKIDLEGNIEWEQNYGGTYSDGSSSIQQTNDDGFIVAGSSVSYDGDVGGNFGQHDFWIFKLDSEGNIEWGQNYGGSYSDSPSSIKQTRDNGFLIAGISKSYDGDVGGVWGIQDCWIVKLAPLPVLVPILNNSPRVSILPNPSKGAFTIQLDIFLDPIDIRIFNNLGTVIYLETNVQSSLQIDDIQKGNYFINISSDKFNLTKKIIVF